MLMISVI